MSQTSKASILTLPTEILHQIFNDLDTLTLIRSVRNVCRRLRVTTDSYNQYTLDFTSVSKHDFRRVLVVIRPENVTTLILFEHGIPLGEVDVLHPPINIDPFIRLRSLTVMNTDGTRVREILQHARRCSLTSLILHLRSFSREPAEKREITEHLSSIVAQPTLVRLELLDEYLSSLIDPLKWPSQCKLRSLSMTRHAEQTILSKILDRLPSLKTLVFRDKLTISERTVAVCNEGFSAIYSRLISLTILSLGSLLSCVDSLLSHTPSLVYLKITGYHPSIFNESRLEELIRTKLPALNKLEFHTVYRLDLFHEETGETRLNQRIAPFRTPFWTEDKRWLVICTWHPNNKYIQIFTPLVSTPNYVPSWHPNTLTVTNFTRQGEYYTKYEDVLRLQFVSREQNHFENTVSNDDKNDIKIDLTRISFFLSRIDRSAITCFRMCVNSPSQWITGSRLNRSQWVSISRT